MVKKLLFLIFFGIFTALLSQEGYSDFYKMREKYENFPENDHRAFPFIQPYINKAKREKNYEKLVQGYKDGVFYSFSSEDKLKYADSMIWAANQSKNEDLRIISHIDKGVVYYYHYKKYQLALNEYLEAYKYSKNTKNEYLKFQNLYHLGVIKSYLGYYEDASDLFMKCLVHYREKTRQITKLHPNEIYNNKKGYLNSLYQMIICYRHLGKYKEADDAIETGFSEIGEDPEFDLEKGYFLLSRGISEYRNNRFQPALQNLSASLPAIKSSRDFARLSVGYFYIGKSYSGLKRTKESIIYFKKIDSIFRQHQFMLPELRENYEILIDYSKKEKNEKHQLYYTSQLLRADSIMSKDFIYLSPKMHKDYDTNNLLEEKDKLQKINYLGTIIIIVLIVWAVGLVALLTRRHKKAKEIQQKYVLVEEKFAAGQNTEKKEEKSEIIPLVEEKKFSLNENKVEELLQKLKTFEDKKEFTQKGLTISKLAAQLGTNSNYLSQVVNEYKKVNFNKYLSELRINYITNLLFEDKKYLKYNIETLARECGIASRQNFSDLFYEINGIRPTDFIKKRKEEIEGNA
ncbi:helix-turn-helix domain-containing protein [uncultured Chryseobacterium sp.]|uniref:helix-turn-helix domain-containing protein n=1 Tax=uncultured Chryseobacterium sp. TaxID=259322 RepID=UPI0025F34174|nr:helix-turn-helix domain-containing protein [uncultured Chryseobacterium sp.]